MKRPVIAPQLPDLLVEGGLNLEHVLGRGIGPEVDGTYEHWDHLRHLTPPVGLAAEGWWASIKFARRAIARELPLHDKVGHPFTVSITGTMQRKLHFLDREAAGVILGAGRVDGESVRRRYLGKWGREMWPE